MKKILNKDFLILLLLTLTFFSINMLVPYIGIDDFYAHSSPEYTNNLILRGINRGLTWNMRIGEIIFFTIGYLPKIVYNIVISLFFACFLILIKKYSNTNYENKVSQYILYYFLIMFFIISVMENMFKMSDTCNHLIGTCLILLTLLPLIKYDKGIDTIKGNKVRYSLFIILSFFAGMASENNSIFILIFYMYIIIKNIIKSKKIARWQIFSFISTLSGYILLVFNKSTFYRIEYFNSITFITNNTPLVIFNNFYFNNKYYIILFITLLILYLVINLIKYRKNFKIDSKIKYNLFLLILSTTTLLMFIFSPYYSNKGVLFVQFILIVNIVDLINILTPKLHKNILIILSFILLIINAITSYKIGLYFYKYKVFDKERDINITNQINNPSYAYYYESNTMNDYYISIKFPIFKEKYNGENIFYYQELTVCDEEIIRSKYNINYKFMLICE